MSVQIGNLHFFNRWIEVASGGLKGLFALQKCSQTTLVLCGQPEFSRTKLIGRLQPIPFGGKGMSAGLGFVSPPEVRLGNDEPFFMPAFLVSGFHPAGGQKRLADASTALLRLAKRTAELIRQPRMFGPVLPTIGLVMRRSVG